MTTVSLHYLPGNKNAAETLARHLDVPVCEVLVHHFPDGESKLRVQPVQGTAILFATLDHPDDKLMQLAFAASALRDSGAARVVLVAPYLCYMRQDMAFQAGEAVSQRVMGQFLSASFDRVVTVDPHLHRIDDLQSIFSNCQADSLSASSLIAEALAPDVYKEQTLFVGPDAESRQWVSSIADKLALPYIVGEKIRLGDRQVSVTLPKDAEIAGRRAIIVDDMISSGMTLCRCAEALIRAGAKDVQAVTVHALCSPEDVAAMMQAGISHLQSADSIDHPTNTISLAPLLADALKQEL